MKLEIAKTLVLSTAHISKETNDKMREIAGKTYNLPFRVADHEYGFIIFLQDKYEEDDITRVNIFAPELGPAIKLARKNDCTFINYDADADCYYDLKQYEW